MATLHENFRTAISSHYEIVGTLHDTQRTRICRALRLPGREPFILKCLKPEAAREGLAQFRRESEILRKTAGVAGVVKLNGLDEFGGGLAMVLEDIGGTSLDMVKAALPVSEFLNLAIGLAGTLAELHHLRITHKAIRPEHIILNREDGQFCLVGFGSADEVPELNVAFPPASTLSAPSLAYTSPEQTGRMNRAVDYRTDFYSLGVVLYELLTGRLPFTADDRLGLIHCHIAIQPLPPSRCAAAIPGPLSDIVMKLMAKMAENRYQSGLGLQSDLERCRRELQQEGTISDFELGERDLSEQMRVPQKLYGREREIKQLLRAFERVRDGERELLLVAGYSGVGKTSLVHEVHRPIVAARGHFLEGKFDQLQRNKPHSGWIQAFTGLVRAVLMESEGQLAQWKQRILQAVGDIGRVLTEVMPNLELIIGPQPTVPVLGATEAQNRLKYVLLKFIQAIATSEHPLVVFLDDLQWIDAASLNLLQTLIGGAGVSHLLVIGAYRDNEVGALHPLSVSLELLQREQANVEQMHVPDLSELTVNILLAETLLVPLEQTRSLTHLIYTKTGGNPFFLVQTLRTLVEKKAIRLDLQRRYWTWDMSLLQGMGITDNVIALMLGKIQQLPRQTQQILPLAACMGFRFDLANLGIIVQQPDAVALEHLQPAVREGLVTPLAGSYQFVHDRIQQAAYALIPDAQKKQLHLEIGRLLLKHIPEREQEEQIFTVMDHLNMGAELLSARDEKTALARLNLRAGSKAKASAAFSAAAKYFEAGVDLALELHSKAGEAASLTGAFERTDQVFHIVSQNARTAEDMVDALLSQIHSYISQGKLQEAVDTSLEGFERLGLSLPGYPTDEDIARTIEETKSLYAGIAVEDLINLPRMTDPNKLAILRIHSKSGPAAYISRPPYVLLQILSQVSVCIEYGNADESPNAYASYATFLCGLQQEYDEGYRFAKLALALLEVVDSSKILSKTMCMIGGHVWHYRHHLKDTLPYLEEGYQDGLKTGDFENAGYDAEFCCSYSYFAGVQLHQVEKVIDSYGESVKQIRAEAAAWIIAPYWQAVKNLLRTSGDPCALVGEKFNQEVMLPVYEQKQNRSALAAFYVNRLILCYLFEQYEQAFESAMLAEKNKGGMLGMFTDSVSIFYDSLSRIQVCPHRATQEQPAILERIAANQQIMKGLANSAPMNFLHKFYLVEAERMRLAGEGMAALDYYDKAISQANENGYVQEEALANELAAGFCSGKGKDEFARAYMKEAYRCYEAWGAVRKIKDLEQRYPYLHEKPREENAGAVLELLDLSTLMKATNAISRQMEMDKLLSEVLHHVIENAGAQEGFLLQEIDGKWVIVARRELDRTQGEISRLEGAEPRDALAMGVVHFVARTYEHVVLEDAASGGGFVSDPHIQQQRTKSLLCAPLLSQGRLVGILYLENNLTTHAFTPERVQLLEMLLAQAAISLENARVYEALRKTEERHRITLQTALDGFFRIDMQGRILEVNEAYCRISSYSEQELRTMQLADISAMWTAERITAEIRKTAEEGSQRFDSVHRRKDGTLFDVEVSAQYQPIAGGQIVAFVRDITDRKRAEKEHERLRQLEAELAHLDRLTMLGELTASIAHEVNQPLSGVVSNAGACLRWLAGDAPDLEEAREATRRIVRDGKRAGEVIARIRAMTRRTAPAREKLDLNETLRQVLALVEDEAKRKRVGIRTKFANDLFPVSGDQVQLQQVALNLSMNAIEAMSSVDERARELVIQTRNIGPDQVQVTVKDSGVGLDPNATQKIFEPFYTTKPAGMGMGLSISRSILQSHGGRLWATANDGPGTIFYFTLPRYHEEKTHAGAVAG